MALKSKKGRKRMQSAVEEAVKAVDATKRTGRKTSAETPAAIIARQQIIPPDVEPKAEEPKTEEKGEDLSDEPTNVIVKPSPAEAMSLDLGSVGAEEAVPKEPEEVVGDDEPTEVVKKKPEPQPQAVRETIEEEARRASLQQAVEAQKRGAGEAARPAEVGDDDPTLVKAKPSSQIKVTPAPAEKPAVPERGLPGRWGEIDNELGQVEPTEAQAGAAAQESVQAPEIDSPEMDDQLFESMLKTAHEPSLWSRIKTFYNDYSKEILCGVVVAAATWMAATSKSLTKALGSTVHAVFVGVTAVTMFSSLAFHIWKRVKGENGKPGDTSGTQTDVQNR